MRSVPCRTWRDLEQQRPTGDPFRDGGLLGISSSGGTPQAITTLDRSKGELAHIAPHFLPDGGRFLYVIRNADASRSGLWVSQVGSTEPKLLLGGEHPAIYATPGYLLFSRDGSIVAQRLNLDRLELTGEAMPLVAPWRYWPTPVQGGDLIPVNWFGVWPSFSVSATAVLTYAIAEHPKSQFLWVRRNGERLELIGDPGPYLTLALSPDDARLAFSRSTADHADVWVRDLTRGVSSRLTFGVSSSYYDPRFGPQGQWVAANRPTPPPQTIVAVTVDGRESVVSAPENCILDDVSRDGRYLTCRPRTNFGQLIAVPLSGGGTSVVVRNAPAGAVIDQSRFSADGRWIAYNTDESGTYEVYVTPFPPTGERSQVSRGGGVQPVWGRGDREVYYLGPEGALNVVEIRTGNGPEFSIPKRLFDSGLRAPSPWVEQYAVSRDGQRILILKPVTDTVRNSIGVILNWPALLPPAASR